MSGNSLNKWNSIIKIDLYFLFNKYTWNINIFWESCNLLSWSMNSWTEIHSIFR